MFNIQNILFRWNAYERRNKHKATNTKWMHFWAKGSSPEETIYKVCATNTCEFKKTPIKKQLK